MSYESYDLWRVFPQATSTDGRLCFPILAGHCADSSPPGGRKRVAQRPARALLKGLPYPSLTVGISSSSQGGLPWSHWNLQDLGIRNMEPRMSAPPVLWYKGVRRFCLLNVCYVC